MWHLGTWFCGGLGSVRLTVGLEGLRALLHPKGFCDSKMERHLGTAIHKSALQHLRHGTWLRPAMGADTTDGKDAEAALCWYHTEWPHTPRGVLTQRQMQLQAQYHTFLCNTDTVNVPSCISFKRDILKHDRIKAF